MDQGSVGNDGMNEPGDHPVTSTLATAKPVNRGIGGNNWGGDPRITPKPRMVCADCGDDAVDGKCSRCVVPTKITMSAAPLPPARNAVRVYPAPEADMVNHPPHYKANPSGVECIVVAEHMNFCRGNALKYIWRAGAKGGAEQEIEDLEKARWYLDREIQRLKKGAN